MAEMQLTDGKKIKQLRKSRKWTQADLVNESKKIKNSSFSLRSLKTAEQGGPIGTLILESLSRIFKCEASSLVRTTKLYTLYECQREFARWHTELPQGKSLRFQTIVIDLAVGWEHIVAAVNLSRGASTHFQILMLTENVDQLAKPSPPEVEAWSVSAAGHLHLLQSNLASYSGSKKIYLELRQYSCMPTVHGMRVDFDEYPSRYYLTNCRFSDGEIPTYEWGEGQYRCFTDEGGSESEIEHANRFDNLFEGLWRLSNKVVDFESQ